MKPATPSQVFYSIVVFLMAAFALRCVPQDLGEACKKSVVQTALVSSPRMRPVIAHSANSKIPVHINLGC